MAYRLAKERKVWWKVSVMSAVDGGSEQEESIEILYLLIDRDELKQAAQGEKAAPGGVVGLLTKLAGGAHEPEDEAFMKKHVLGWRNVLTEDGTEVPFTFENLKVAMNDLRLAKAVSTGLYEASYGAPRKN